MTFHKRSIPAQRAPGHVSRPLCARPRDSIAVVLPRDPPQRRRSRRISFRLAGSLLKRRC